MKNDYKHTELVGPFITREYHRAVINGFEVPHIKIFPLSGQDDGKTEIMLDERMVYVFDTANVDLILNLVANAMAFGAGYPCFGSENKHNPFRVGLLPLGPINTQEGGVS